MKLLIKFVYILLIAAICSLQTPCGYAQSPVPPLRAEVAAAPITDGPYTEAELIQTKPQQTQAGSILRCCICFEPGTATTSPQKPGLKLSVCPKIDWGNLCENKNPRDLIVNCSMIPKKDSSTGAPKDEVVCSLKDFMTKGLNMCSEKYYIFATSSKKEISLDVWGSQKQCAPCRALKKELAKELARLAKKGITLKINDHDSNTISEAADAAHKATKLDVRSVPFAAVNESSKFKKVDALEYIKAQEKILDDKK